MKKSFLTTVLEWLVICAVLLFTIGGTLQIARITTQVTGIPLYFRQFAAVALTDGMVILWHILRGQYVSDNQRNVSLLGLVSSAVMTFAFGFSVNILSVAGLSGGNHLVDIGDGVMVSLTDVIGYGVTGLMFAQFGLSFGLILYCQLNSPAERIRVEGAKARGILAERTVNDYKVGQAAVLGELSSTAAVKQLVGDLVRMGYSEAEAAHYAEVARRGIWRSKPPQVDDGNHPPEAAQAALSGRQGVKKEPVSVPPFLEAEPEFSNNGHR